MNNTKRNSVMMLTILSILMLISSLALGTFAYYRIMESGWGQQIVTTSVTFKVNGQTIIGDATSYDLGLLERGDSADIVLEVVNSAKVRHSVYAEYKIDLSTAKQNNENQELARAIEVYRYTDGEYKFVDTLANMQSISNIIPINSTENLYYKFVYSKTASDYFENTDFTLRLTANASIYTGNVNLVYVNDATSFIEAITVQNNNKTVVLTNGIDLTRSDIASNMLSVNANISFDLAGNTLNLGENNIQINASSELSAQPFMLKIENSSPFVGGIKSNGAKLRYQVKNGLVLVDDKLSESFNLIDIQDQAEASQRNFDELGSKIYSQLKELASDIKYKGSEINFLPNLKYYFMTDNSQYQISLVENNVFSYNADKLVCFVNNDYAEPMTKTQDVIFNLSRLGMVNKQIKAGLTIRGTDEYAIANYWLSQVPDVVSESLYLPSYDNESNSTITWISSNENVLNDYGIYLPNGYEGLDTYSDLMVELTVVINNVGYQQKESKSVLLTLLTAEEKTNIIYNYEQYLLSSLGETVDIYNTNINKLEAEKTGLSEIRITSNDDIFTDYLTKDSANSFDVLTVIKLAKQQSMEVFSINIEFTYKYEINGSTIEQTFNVDRTVSILGEDKSSGVYDPTNILQIDFSVNPYIDGNDYIFNVKATTSEGANVDYFVNKPYSEYIMLENDIYEINDENKGEFIYYDLNNDGNKEYMWRYRKEGVSYLLSNEGEYIFNGTRYINISSSISSNTYDKFSRITILPELVPSVENTIAIIKAQLWEDKNASDDKVYLKDESNNLIELIMKLNIDGLYQNTPEDIESYAIYSKLKEIYDIDNDNYISVKEANTKWQDLPAENSANLNSIDVNYNGTDTAHQYIDLKNKYIKNLKGLELFPYIKGLDLSNNKIINIDYLSEMFDLEYLNLANNNVTHLEKLGFLDSLNYLNINNIPISSIESIRYLPNLKYLDMNNSPVLSYEPLTEFNSLCYVDIRGGSDASASTETQYFLALTYRDNRHNNIIIYNDKNKTNSWIDENYQALDTIVAGCTVLSQMVVVEQAYQTLNVPNSYVYTYHNGNDWVSKKYKIKWNADPTQSNLTFDQNGGYTIISPIVDTMIEVTISIEEVDGDNTSAINITKKIQIKLLQSQENSPRIQVASGGEYILASSIVTDSVLLEILFEIFNTNNDNDLSYDEITEIVSTDYSGKFKDRGIKILSGINYFTGIAFDLDLRGNLLDSTLSIGENQFSDIDLTPLRGLVNMTGLRLSGQLYDFSQISDHNGTTSTGLNGLNKLYVEGCFALDDNQVLSSLYQVYLSNSNVDIYIEGDPGLINNVAWNPYEEFLEKELLMLPKTYHFKNKGDIQYIYGDENKTSIILNPYGIKEVEFKFTEYLMTSVLNRYVIVQDNTRKLICNRYSATNVIEHILFTISGNDGRGDNLITAKHIAGIDVEFNDNIVVVDFDTADGDNLTHATNKKTYTDISGNTQSTGYVSLDHIFSSLALRLSVLDKFTSIVFQTNDNKNSTDPSVIGGYYSKIGDMIYITKATLKRLYDGGEFNFGYIYDSNEKGSQLNGLKYLSLETIRLWGNVNLGDGLELVNLKKLYISGSYVSFANITTDLPNLQVIALGGENIDNNSNSNNSQSNQYLEMCSYQANGEIYYNMKHFTGLEELYIANCGVYDWEGLRGVIDINGGGNKISKLAMTESTRYQTNYNVTSGLAVYIVTQIYENSTAENKDYRIGTKNEPTDYKTSFDPTAWEITSTEIKNEITKDYEDLDSYITNFGAKVNGERYDENMTQTLNGQNVLTLPTDTSQLFYGLVDDDNTQNGSYAERRFAIDWYLVGIDDNTANAILNSEYSKTENLDQRNGVCIHKSKTGVQGELEFTLNALEYDTYFVLAGVTDGSYYYYDERTNNIFVQNGDKNPSKIISAYPILLKGTNMLTNRTQIPVSYGDNQSANITSSYFYEKVIGDKTATYLSYGVFDCLETRLVMASIFTKLAENKKNNDYALPGMMLYNVRNTKSGITTYTGVTGVASFKHSIDGNFYKYSIIKNGQETSVSLNNSYALCMFIGNNKKLLSKSLQGLQYFISLRDIELNDMFITSLEPLAKLADWSDRKVTTAIVNDKYNILLRSNGITDISAFENFKNIESLDLANNDISSLGTDNFVLANSLSTLKTLNLENNFGITKDDIDILNSAMENSSYPLETLNINGISEQFDYDLLGILANIAEKSASGSLNLSVNGGVDVSFNKSKYEDFISDISNDPVYSAYSSLGYSADEQFVRESNSLSFKFVDEEFLQFNANNEPLIPGSSIPVGTLLKMKISHNTSSILAFYEDIQIHDKNGNSSNPNLQIGETQNLNGENIDPSIWLAFVKFAENGVLISPKEVNIIGIPQTASVEVKESNSTLVGNILTIYTSSIKTLDGLQYLDALNKLTIKNVTSLDKFFTNTNSKLEENNFELIIENSPSIDEDVLMGIIQIKNLKRLNLSKQPNIDYLKRTSTELTIDKRTVNTVGGIIGYGLKKIIEFHYDNTFNLNVYDANNLQNSMYQHYIGTNTIFNLPGAKSLKSFEEITSMETTKHNTLVRNDSFLSSVIARDYILNGNSIVNGTTSIHDTYKAFEYALLFSKRDNGRNILPNIINQDSITGDGVIFFLPKQIYFDGYLLDVVWSVALSNGGSLSGEYLNAETGVFTMNSTNFKDADNGKTFKLSAQVKYNGEILTDKDGSKNEINLAFYKEIDIVPSENIVEDTDDIPAFYVEINPDEFVKADTIFTSNDVLTKLFFKQSILYYGNKNSIKDTVKSFTSEDALKGSYLTNDAIQSVERLHIYDLASLEGMQIFTNVKEILIYNSGTSSISDLSPLRDLQLTSFEHYSKLEFNSVFDYSALINSADTLKIFRTSFVLSNGKTGGSFMLYKGMEDLTFLKMFNNIENIELSVNGELDSKYNEYQKQYVNYNLRYIKDWFDINKPSVNFNIIFNGKFEDSVKKVVGELYVDTDKYKYSQENDILSSFTTTNLHDIESQNGAIIKIKNSYYNDNNVDYTLKAPAYAKHGSQFYKLYYNIYDSHAEVLSTVYSGQTFTVNIDGTDKTYQTGTKLTYGELEKLLQTQIVKDILLNDKGDFYKEINLKGYDLNQKFYLTLEMGIKLNGLYYSRNITLYNKIEI